MKKHAYIMTIIAFHAFAQSCLCMNKHDLAPYSSGQLLTDAKRQEILKAEPQDRQRKFEFFMRNQTEQPSRKDDPVFLALQNPALLAKDDVTFVECFQKNKGELSPIDESQYKQPRYNHTRKLLAFILAKNEDTTVSTQILTKACLCNDYPLVSFALLCQADPNATNNKNQPLILTPHVHRYIREELRSYGANIDYTMIHTACSPEYNTEDLNYFLREFNEGANRKDENKLTPLETLYNKMHEYQGADINVLHEKMASLRSLFATYGMQVYHTNEDGESIQDLISNYIVEYWEKQREAQPNAAEQLGIWLQQLSLTSTERD